MGMSAQNIAFARYITSYQYLLYFRPFVQVPLRNITWRYLRDFKLPVNPNTTRQRIQETHDGGLELALFLDMALLSPSSPNITVTLAVNSTDQVFFNSFVLMYRFR